MNPASNNIAFAVPLIVGLAVTVCTIVVHAAAGMTTMRVAQWHFARGRAGASIAADLPIIMGCLMVFMCAHLIEMGEWAVLLMRLGEFHGFATAFYHSAENYTTLGYGELVMGPNWRLLGPLEATDGMLMFGLSTAILFNLIIRLGQLRSQDHIMWAERPARKPQTGERH